jgi:hypothetical protein
LNSTLDKSLFRKKKSPMEALKNFSSWLIRSKKTSRYAGQCKEYNMTTTLCPFRGLWRIDPFHPNKDT